MALNHTCRCSTLVVARYNESLDWTTGIQAPVAVVQKTANVGRESLSFLQWIVEHYAHIEHEHVCVCFAQGGPFISTGPSGQPCYLTAPLVNAARLIADQDVARLAPCQAILQHTACGLNPRWQLPCFGPLLRAVLGRHAPPEDRLFRTFAGAFMIVRSAAITRLPLDVYWYLLAEHFGAGCALRVPWAMERLWRHLFMCRECTPHQKLELPVLRDRRCRGVNGSRAARTGPPDYVAFPPEPLAGFAWAI